jgi:catechol 2,3-dioxygenase-like lactoylglutathione lyase family enzyme
MPQIRHIAIHTREPEQLAQFYIDVFGMTVHQSYPSTEGSERAVFLTDGYMEVALIHDSREERQGIDHFGFTLDPNEKPEVYQKLAAYGIEPRKRPAERPYAEDRLADIQGNKIDVTTSGLRLTLPSN